VKESNASGYLESHQSDAIFDEETGQYYIYYEEGKTSYMCWLEEARSLSVKLEAVKSYGVGGVAFWRLGYEDPAIYDDLWKAYDAN
jgi:spore germination protein YaaH